MTNQEAIKYLIKPVSTSTSDGEEKQKEFEAYKMAIEALEKLPCDPCLMSDKKLEECNDVISRSEAIRVASGYCHWANIPKELAKLPSVTPQQKTEWIPASKAPSEDGKHLVVCKSIGMGCNLMYIANYAKDLSSVDDYDFENEQRGGWYYYDSESGYFEMSDVIAYMPLPEPFKGVEE